MNNFTRQLVYPTITLVFVAGLARAEAVHHSPAAADPQQSSDVTQNILLRGSDLIIQGSMLGSSESARSFGVSLLPSGEKVLSFETGGTDSTEAGSQAGADQVVSDASAQVNGAVDSTDLAVATTSVAQASGADSASGEPSVIVSQVGAPEPSTLLLVGSMFIGVGMTRRRRSANR